MKITNWPQYERPREKLLQFGAQTLSDAELLAIVLHTGVKGKNALELAREALVFYGSVRALMSASKTQLTATLGFGVAKYAT